MLLGFGLAFELPLAMVILNLGGVLTHDGSEVAPDDHFRVFVFAVSPRRARIRSPCCCWQCRASCSSKLPELVIWANDRRRANRPDPYAGLRDDELSPIDLALPLPRRRRHRARDRT